MNRIRNLLAHLEECLGAVLLLGVCGITLLNVASRYLANRPLSWAEELATILFVWLVMLGAALALKEGQHFAVTMLLERLRAARCQYEQRLANALSLAACLLLLTYGLVYTTWAVGAVTPSMGISRVWLYAAIPFGAALMSVRAAQQLARDWNHPPLPAQETPEK